MQPLLDPYDGSEYRWDVLAEIRGRHGKLLIVICLPFEMAPDDRHVGLADGCIIKSSDVSGLASKVQSLLATKVQGRAPVDSQWEMEIGQELKGADGVMSPYGDILRHEFSLQAIGSVKK